MEVKNINDSEFESLIKEHKKVVVKFYAAWCGSCRLITPKFKKLAANEDYNDVVFVEVDAENNPNTRSMAKVHNLPFFASFKDGVFSEGFPSAKIEVVEEMTKNL